MVNNIPGFEQYFIIKRLPRIITQRYTRKMSLEIAKGITEKGIVRLVKVAAGVPQ